MPELLSACCQGAKYVNPGEKNTEFDLSTRWGLGGALSLRFSKEYTVVLMGRREVRLPPVHPPSS